MTAQGRTAPPMADLSNPDDPAVIEAKTRKCDQCLAPIGEFCAKRQGFRDDLAGRLVHI